MKQRICALALGISLVLGILVFPAAAGELSHFAAVRAYTGQFQDVPQDAWYAGNVKTAYECGLVNGKSDVRFDPGSNLSVAEAVKLAACIHSIYETGKAEFAVGNPWYQPYADYLQNKNLLKTTFASYEAKATRAQFATLLAASLPAEALQPINEVKEGAIPDVALGAAHHDAAYLLYRAGILTGSDSRGSFKPDTFIARNEVATVVARMVDVNQRKLVELSPALSAQEVFAQCSPAVAYLEVFDAAGKLLGTGSGFFISADGRLVTNYHVMENAASIKVKTTDGKLHKVLGAYDASPALDLALLQVEGTGFSSLLQGDSQNLSTGAAVFAIGSPLGLENSLSTGIVASPSRTVDNTQYIQITAPISSGSSGGALLNDLGQVIGVTTASLVNGQSLNLAVPIHLLSKLKTGTYQDLSKFTPAVGAVSMTASPATVSVQSGKSVTVTYAITDPSQVTDTCLVEIADPTILDYEYGDWYTDDLPLYLYGLKAGTTTVTMRLYDIKDNLLATHSLTVTVTAGTAGSTGASAVTYYPGWYPAPDYGAFVGMDYDYKSADGTMYTYPIWDLPVDSDTAVSGYFDLLLSQGFYYDYDFYDDYGNLVTVFRCSSGVYLMFSLDAAASDPCIVIFVSR